ncbi:LOW QUALITY PROTEIN: SAG family member [Eimeria mitis]|uniref:SAG family member n=1 Tax=Eimeria mitis TaxID=44415 RepID=U6KMG5_9EIME|nr:LOW QUALITY PROTEIN: SAG family member [Eimeria mitis]CDJ36648.1 SAG family member [Eimeria mitis]
MNAARNRVGFAELTVGKEEGEKLPIDAASSVRDGTVDAYVGSVCTALKGDEVSAQGSATLAGTYAYAVQEGASADCEAAVEHWKAAFSNFNGLPPRLPPQYTEDTEPYDNPQNISFISLFNPSENPKVDCAYFTCPAKKAGKQQQDVVPPLKEPEEVEEDDPESSNDVESPNPGGGSESITDKEVKALVCVTTPDALKKESAPYTQAQWDQITAGLNKNAAPALPTFLGFAATAAGILFL